ncbi:MAG: CHAT domain-containing tetratricopeptide repeat protein, partial [Thermodesulfobacteriota bacterium]|nr:CHAT domain-containing tetratricopeptide repeat protein [Thermodesulfobacteriota bacterium]
PEHPRTAATLASLAVLYSEQGDYVKCELLFKKALAIREKVLGPEHPEVAFTMYNLATLYVAAGKFEEANNLFKKAQKIDDKLIDQVMGFTSEEQKIRYLVKKKGGLNIYLSFVSQYLAQNASARKDAFNVWLKRKGFVLEVQKRFRKALFDLKNPLAVKTFEELLNVRIRLSNLTFGMLKSKKSKTILKNMEELEQAKNKLEAKLSQISQAYARAMRINRADSEKVSQCLPFASVLVDFAKIPIVDFHPKSKENQQVPWHYLAFVLFPGNPDDVRLIDLGDAERINKTIIKFKKELANTNDTKGVKAIKSAEEIYNLVFAPLRKEIGYVKEIFISPDGILNLIPFEVFKGPDGRFLIEDYTFNYLASGRDMLGFGQIKRKERKALLMGDPDFDMEIEKEKSMIRGLALKEINQKKISKRSSEMKGFYFSKLPFTKKEVMAIQALFGKENSEIYVGKEALEKVLEHMETPSILHLATHGFFLSDLEIDDLYYKTISRGISIVPNQIGKGVKIKNPLLRSGIALACANSALKSGDVGESSGIVTAEKILGLRLRGTDMVVLSACKTGTGDVIAGEGVFGLRRAFNQAGAKSMVMSMWSVPDKETQELMVEFYKNIISGRMNRCQALRQAVLKEINIVKEKYGHANPLFWGAFVFIGEP